MPRWTQQEYDNWIRKNPKGIPVHSIDDSGKVAFVEHTLVHESLAKIEAEKKITDRILVRVESVRRRLLDEDNLSEKGIIDCLRYAGIIPCDSPDKVKIEVSQRKCKKGEGEHTEILIFK